MLAKSEDDLSMQILRREQQRIGGLIKDGKLFPIGPHLTALLPLQPASDLQRRWHVVQTEPQQEGKVAEELDESKFDVFNPQVPKRIRVNPVRHRTVKRPMLPGYVFVGFDVRAEPWWDRIRDMRGVLRLLQIGERPVPVPNPVIEHLRTVEVEENDGTGRPAKGPAITLKIGQFVRILEPFCFAGLFGNVTSIDDKAREIGVEIDIFGRMVPLRLEPEQMEVV
jgi:transcriptional antiterminator RfaH